MTRLFFSLLFIVFSTFSFGQISLAEKQYVNEQMEYANLLIDHINGNIGSLELYQAELNDWAFDTSSTFSQLPVFDYDPLDISWMSNAIDLPENSSIHTSKTNLVDFQNQIIFFENLCIMLKQDMDCTTKKECYEMRFLILQEVETSLKGLYNSCYSFSLSCSIVYGKTVISEEHEQIKDVIAQSKNIIMSLHDEYAEGVFSFVKLLDESIQNVQAIDDYDLLLEELDEEYTSEELNAYVEAFVSSAMTISNYGIQYINQVLTEEEYLVLLNQAIIEFDAMDGMVVGYNTLVQQNIDEYIFYLKEPRYFKTIPVQFVDEIEVPEDNNSSTSSIENEEYVWTLDGAKPNNIVILMDVSASMSSSGKFDMLKSAIESFAGMMRAGDYVSLISYSGYASVLLEGATNNQSSEIIKILKRTISRGGTDAERGLKMAYQIANEYYLPDGNNTIIVASDGEFKLNTTMYPFISSNTQKGIVTSIFHFQGKTVTDESSQFNRIAESGGGNYFIIKDDFDAHSALFGEATKQ